MKKILLFCSGLLTSAFAQTNTFPTSGNVGIGLISPQSLLSISTSSASTIPTTGIVRIGNYDYTGQTNKQILSLAPGIFGIDKPGLSNGAFIVNESFNVGIGMTNPIARLHVVNTSNDLQFQIGDGTRDVSINAASSNITAEVLRYQSGANLLLGSSGILGKVSINTSGGERLTVISSGNVGIGTTSPTEKLSVNGNIRSKKLIVTQTGWSDHVFDSSYQLKPLSEIEQFIKSNKHLPDVPSAREVEKDGIDVGDNQAVLLMKIEELTLYMIKQQKQIEEQQKRINNLETQVAQNIK